jgi:hypothetical protein
MGVADDERLPPRHLGRRYSIVTCADVYHDDPSEFAEAVRLFLREVAGANL